MRALSFLHARASACLHVVGVDFTCYIRCAKVHPYYFVDAQTFTPDLLQILNMDQPTSQSSRELNETRFTSPASAMTQPSATPIILNMSEKPLQPSSDSDVEKTDKEEAGAEDEGSTAAEQEEAEEEYIGGLKLMLVLAALTLTVFLMMLDMSIITTVRLSSDGCGKVLMTNLTLGLGRSGDHNGVQLPL